ncbi:hypothetical protein [Mesorhizobium sp. M1E.F.Ca.ET.063.01.1.1]|nr:hypothetical protein [Mesorhizobium sp. M1E.F.Ca.ET.063.01.1.1]
MVIASFQALSAFERIVAPPWPEGFRIATEAVVFAMDFSAA